MPKGVYKHKPCFGKTKRKISKKFKGQHHSLSTEFKKGRITWNKNKNTGQMPWNKGKHLSKKIKKKISKAVKGEKNHNWKGGIISKNDRIRKGLEFRLWREAVFIKDNWTCQKCDKYNGEHHPHHIKNFAEYPELRFAIDNGITLCEKCHREFHKIYGIKNNNQEQLEEFLKGRL